MKFGKKSIAGLAASVACMAFAVTAFANSSSISTTGYGTLSGSLSSSGSYGYYTTSVTKNNDNAYLTIAGSAQDKNGTTLITKQQVNSSRGATSYSASTVSLPSSAYVIYGTHGVQGGSTYGASAVYTYTQL
ncbi:hypothetical protein [Paenibacillus pini]|uniref:Uncharacterized protein n=1 Tax=Paenibacillus pini JCM 16418 TaxID=1236976 RepID=W7YEF6_9BACL|nr:hypothetical protein [Paenibacillus pini]GAF09315.1 hypothetical protein JCM16418_3452 [Paenibacillus pini JCM 16418]